MMNRRVLVILIVILLLLISVTGGLIYSLLSSSGGKVITVPHQATATAPNQAAYVGNGCGVTKNKDGTYSFARLHVSPDGKIVNEKGCIVQLIGFNMGALFLGDAGIGDAGVDAVPRKIAWYKQTFHMNLVRINFNSQWWVDDVLVPKANMHFRQWLQQYVKWEEQNGNYVELDEGPHFPEPPCGGTVTHCPSQNQGRKDYDANPNPTTAKELETNIAPGVQAWTDIAKIYANDPAVIYDAWNEPTIPDLPTFFQDMNTLINTIRVQNPQSLVIVYIHGMNDVMSGSFPNYKQPNLVIDAHIYDGFKGTSPVTGTQCSEPGKPHWTSSSSGFDKFVAFAHSHGQGVIVNEWGGCYLTPDYNQAMVAVAKAQGVSLAYFTASNVANIPKNGIGDIQLNDNGRLVQTDYASILGSTSG